MLGTVLVAGASLGKLNVPIAVHNHRGGLHLARAGTIPPYQVRRTACLANSGPPVFHGRDIGVRMKRGRPMTGS